MKEGCRAITSLFDQAGGGDYLGEPVTQQAHALQAAYAALTAGCGSEEVIAALLHDVGHLAFPEAAGMGGYGTK
ncbi:MAG: phosphohydrolase, partial [Proteobacteria bacterium]|nr:phosphohydrolase [Pseudomonadota bacterium]